MKVTAPNDLQGRLIRATNRARMLAETFDAFRRAEQMPSESAMGGLEQLADELADELSAIEVAYVEGGAR